MSKDAFKDFKMDDWGQYIRALNEELPAEECGLNLTEEEIAMYNKELKSLQDDRKKYPDIPIRYGFDYKDIE